MKYRIVYFRGDAREVYAGSLAMQDILVLACARKDWHNAPKLDLVLVPEQTTPEALAAISGDDWDDCPAELNAGRPYERTLPPGAISVSLRLGDVVDLEAMPGVLTPIAPLDCAGITLDAKKPTRGKATSR